MRALTSTVASSLVLGAATVAFAGPIEGQWHMDEIIADGGTDRHGNVRDIVPDDVADRDVDLILGRRVTSSTDTLTGATEPTLIAREGAGSALLYDGVDDTSFVRDFWDTDAYGANGPDSFTFNFDFLANDATQNGRTLLTTVNMFEVRTVYDAELEQMRLNLHTWTDDGVKTATSGWFDAADGAWRHVEAQVSPEELRISVDGDAAGIATYGALADMHHNVLYVGSNHALSGSAARPFDGAIDELTIAIPEPTTASLLGIAGLGLLRRRRA